MGIKKYKPTTASMRWTRLSDFSEITKRKPEKSLLKPIKKTGGRNAQGRITTHHRGGGHKRLYRIIDFRRDKFDLPGFYFTFKNGTKDILRVLGNCRSYAVTAYDSDLYGF